jgi:hypothetical protein
MMSKPWDKLRHQPLREGEWLTSVDGNTVRWQAGKWDGDYSTPLASLFIEGHPVGGDGIGFTSGDLREIAEFMTELAAQLEQS